MAGRTSKDGSTDTAHMSAQHAFAFQAATRDGRLQSGQIQAVDLAEAQRRLRHQGLATISIAPTRDAEPWWKREILRAKFNSAGVARFTSELSTLLQAGVSIGDALGVMIKDSSDRRLEAIASKILGAVMDGATFSDAIKSSGMPVADAYLSAIKAGESSGRLGPILAELARLLEQGEALRSSIVSALVYPAILLALAAASIVLLIGVLVPNITPIFTTSGQPLPTILWLLISIQDHIVSITTALGMVICLLVLLTRSIDRSVHAGRAVDRLKLSVPLLGSMILDRETSQFTRTLGVLLAAGVPIVPALSTARDTVRNRFIAANFGSVIDDVRAGQSLATALGKVTSLRAATLRLIAIGEETGQMPALLAKTAELHQASLSRSLLRATALLSPTLTVLIAGLIGGLMMSVIHSIHAANDVVLR